MATGLTVAVKELSYAVRPRSWRRWWSERLELLHNVDFIARPATLTAILGPSGCGKTTLLNIISARARGKVTRGSIAFNGNVTSAAKLKGAVALLNANDRLLAYLNVRETLMFTAYLKMPNATKAERNAHVDTILEDLALTHAQHTVVGGAWKKGLSSGEMRRCSIAMELLGSPSVLLLDEPTSGLDAVLAYEVVSVLKKLAAKGKTIVCTLHQPRSSVCRLLDNVAVMAKGHIIFQGSLNEAHQHFLKGLGRDISRQGNYADDLLDIANGIDDADESWPQAAAPAAETNAAYRKHRTPPLNSAANVWKEALEVWLASPLHAEQAAEIRRETENPPRRIVLPKNDKNAVLRYCMEVYGVAYRTFRNSWNNPLALIMSMIVQTAMGVFLGFVFFRLPYKFLPAERPVDIGDANSPAMKILDLPIVTFLANGVDGAGTNPLLDMIIHGVDGKGSDPLRALLESGDPSALSSAASPSSTVYRLANMIPCVMRRLQLEKTGWYVDSSNFTSYYPAWNPEVPATDGRPNAYNEPPPQTSLDAGNKLVFGEANPPAMTRSLMQSLEFFDYMFYNLPWREAHEMCSENYASSYIPCFGCHGEIGAFLDAASECTNIPEQPNNFLSPCTNRVQGGGSYNPPRITVFDENGDFQRNKAGGIMYPRRVPPQPRPAAAPTPLEPTPAPARRLQISGLMGGGIDIYSFLPPTLLGMADAGKRYLEAVRECAHPVCVKVTEIIDGSSVSKSGSLIDYAAVIGAILNIAGALFFSVTMLGFGAYDGLTGLCQDRPLINRELGNHTYKTSSFLIGRTIGDFFFHLIPALMLVTPFYFLIDIDKGPNYLWFARYLLVCLTVSTGAYGFSYMVSALSPSMEVAVIAAPLALVVLVCCSGFFVRDSAIPASMTWFKVISFYRWGFFALVLNQFPVEETYWGIPNSFTLALIGVSETSLWKCIGVILGLSMAFRLVSYFGLKYMHRGVGVET